ncbi:ATP-binding cassette domain-containing protein, partial [Lysinibacillus sp. D4A3_S15]|uniref:ATP-binding cassette domain-containing protein n=1 Tax=Lysinibacillus sp. D4A3_S15 TaxID=2941227 RepID=UPI0020BD7248
FEVQRKFFFALLGSNGAGKTTIVNILSTLMKPDGGKVGICGHDVQRQPDYVRQSISLTGQFAALDGMLTWRENLMMVAKLRGVSTPSQDADNLIA